MLSFGRIERLPGNFDEFIEEVGAGLGTLYGPAAEAEYRANAVRGVQANISHPAVEAMAVLDGDRAAGMLLATHRDGIGLISFIHVLHDFVGRGIEQRLTSECVKTLRAGGVEGIVCDCITFSDLDEEKAFQDLGLRRLERLALGVTLANPARRLYERLGFETWRCVNAFAWWRP